MRSASSMSASAHSPSHNGQQQHRGNGGPFRAAPVACSWRGIGSRFPAGASANTSASSVRGVGHRKSARREPTVVLAHGQPTAGWRPARHVGPAPQAGQDGQRDWINAAARPAVSSALGMCSIMACLSAPVLRRPPPHLPYPAGL